MAMRVGEQAFFYHSGGDREIVGIVEITKPYYPESHGCERLQAFYTVRSERQLMEQLNYNLLFRWFVGLSIDDPVWDATADRRQRRT